MGTVKKGLANLKAWIEAVDFRDDDERRLAIDLQYLAIVSILACLLAVLIYAFIMPRPDTVLTLWITIAIVCGVIWMVRRKKLVLASLAFLSIFLIVLTRELYYENGVRSIGAILYPLLVMMASAILPRRWFVFYLSLNLLSAGFIIYSEAQAWIVPTQSESPSVGVFLVYSLILCATAIIAHALSQGMRNALAQTRQNEQKLVSQSAILDRVGQAVVACASDSTIVYWNKAAADYYGWEAGEVLGKKYHEIIRVRYAPETLEAVGAAFRAGKVWSGELELQKRDHTYLSVISTIAPLPEKDGKRSGWVGIDTDLSERKQVEETLRESEGRFKSIFDYSVIGKSITRLSGEVQVNRAFCEMVGYSQEELRNRRWQEFTHPDDIDLTQREIDALLSGEKEVSRFTKRFIHKNGSVLWVDLSSTLRRDKDGKPLYLMTSLIDITERKQAEDALRESEAKFHSFFSHSLDAMFLVDENGLAIEINRAAEHLLQLKREEALGKPIWEIQISRALEQVRANISIESIRTTVEEAIRTGQAGWLNRVTESQIQLPNGEVRFVQQTSFVIPHGDKFRIASINRDVTEQKQAEAFHLQAETKLRTAAMRQRLLDFSRELLSTVDVGEILEIIRRTAADLVSHDVFSPYWVDEAAGFFRPIETKGRKWFSNPIFQTWTIPLGQGIIGDVARKQQAECVNNSHLDPRAIYPPGFREQVTNEHSIFLPIRTGDKLIGMLVFARRTLPAFTPDEFEMAQLLMSLAELALSNALTFAELEERVAERTAQLAASEERYRLISTVSSDYVFSTGLNDQGELGLNWTAGAFEKITGYTFDEYVACGGWRAALHPDDVEQDTRDMAALYENQPVTTEVRTIAKNGQVHWVRVYAHPVWDAEKNQLVGIYGAVQDITGRRQAEEALRESEEKYRGLIEVSPVGMWINQGGLVTYMNPAAMRILGATSLDQVVGKAALDFVHPDYHSVVKERISQLATRGETVALLQEQYVRLDGSPVDVEVTATTYATDAEQGVQVFFLDITERKQIEAREAYSREMLEKVVQLGKILTQTTSLQQCYTEIQRCVCDGLGFDRVGLFLYNEETRTVQGVIGTDRLGQIEDTSHLIFTADQGTAWRNTLDNPLGIFYVDDYESAYIRQDTEMSDVKEHITVSAWAGEKPIAFLAVDNLITQRKIASEHIEALQLFAGYVGLAIQKARWNDELEQRVERRTAQLATANRELESLSYTISHDMRSPIRAIVAYSQILLEECSGNLEASHKNLLQHVNDVSLRMGQMVDEFLTFLQLDRAVIQKQKVDVNEIVGRVIEELRADITARTVDFLVAPLPVCAADGGLLTDVYLRLISNAIKFTTPRSPARIEIGAVEQDRQTCYFVRDNGVGFNMKYANKLFGVFQRLHHVSEFDGIGIGLAIVQRIIQRHGGRIWAEAEVNKGATFYFTVG